MTDLTQIARKAGLYPSAELRIFADLIRADERERCAKVCEATGELAADMYGDGAECLQTASMCAAAILA